MIEKMSVLVQVQLYYYNILIVCVNPYGFCFSFTIFKLIFSMKTDKKSLFEKYFSREI